MRRQQQRSIGRMLTGLGCHNVRSSKVQLLEQVNSKLEIPGFLCKSGTVAFIGAAEEMGQPLAGTARGPALLRKAGVREMLTSLGWRVEDLGDVDGKATKENDDDEASDSSSMRNGPAVIRGCRRLYDKAKAAHLGGRMVVTVGGDHSIALGSVAAALDARPETRVLWVDAHADANTPETSQSGNMHGMPLAFLLGIADHPLVDFVKNPLEPSRLAYVGLRDIDPAEKQILRSLRAQGTFIATMHDVDKHGIGHVMRLALQSLGYDDEKDENDHRKNLAPLHLSYDVDAIDPQLAPSTGTVVRGGLSFREAHYVCEAAWNTGALGSMDMVEVNDSVGDANAARETIELAASLIASACGDTLL